MVLRSLRLASRIPLAVVVIAVAATAVACTGSEEDGLGVGVTPSSNLAKPAPMAWAVGSDSAVLSTTDGWNWMRTHLRPSRTFLDVDFADPQHGWIVGERGTILRTRDAGRSWTACGLEPEYHLSAVEAVGPGKAWVAGGFDTGTDYTPVVMMTSDGGATWATSYSSTRLGYVYRLAFPNADDGWAVGDEGLVLRTSDCGSSWDESRLGSDTSLKDVEAVDERTIWIVGTGGPLTARDRCRIWRSRDGGGTWQRQAVPTRSALAAVAFLDPRRGLIAASNGAIARTANGGATWRTARRAVGWSDVAVATSSVGFAVGGQSAGFSEVAAVLYVTRDRGVTWTRRMVIGSGWLSAVAVVPSAAR